MFHKRKGYNAMTAYDLKGQVSKQIKLVGNAIKIARPAICFFIFLFYSLLFIFGSNYMMVSSTITNLFRQNHKQSQSVNSLLKICCMQLFMGFLAFVATTSIPLRIILNLVVPFGLIFIKSSQFNQFGYFGSLMTFTFLQLLPVDFHGYLVQTCALTYALTCFLICVTLYQRKYLKVESYVTEQKGLSVFANWLTQAVKGVETKESTEELLKCMQGLYEKAYLAKGNKENLTRDENISYMFALMFQRTAYFIKSHYQKEMLEKEEIRADISKLATYIDQASKMKFWNKSESKSLKKEGAKLLGEIENQSGEIYMYLQNFFKLFLLILDNFEETEVPRKKIVWTEIINRNYIKRAINHFKIDAFEMRFGLRMSAVLTCSFAYVVFMKVDNAYWLPLNAFFLLRPMYEDSRCRAKASITGTIMGCILLYLIVPAFPGKTGHLILASIMGMGMHTAIPGTWPHGLVTTCYSISMATLTLTNHVMMMELRVLHIVMAILVVLAMNKFFLPISAKQQFKYNVEQIFHIHHAYLKILEGSLLKPASYSVICDAQMQYHLIHDQISQYLNKIEMKDKEYYKEMLALSWRMVSETEQIFFLINSRQMGKEEVNVLETYIASTDQVLNEVRKTLNTKIDINFREIKEIQYDKKIEGEPELSFILTQYAKNLSHLYTIGCTPKAEISSL